MRHRFTPNLTPRSGRRSKTSTTSGNTNSPTAVAGENTAETEESTPFIPPNSSKTTQNVAGDEAEHPIDDTSPVVVVEPDTEKAKSTRSKKSKASKELSDTPKPTTARRSRIKPSVTPKPRNRSKTGKDTSTDDNSTPDTLDTSMNVGDEVPNKDKNGYEDTQSQEQVTNPEVRETESLQSSASTTKDASSTEPAPRATTSTADTLEDEKTPANNPSLSRRRRATPKICIPMKRRHQEPAPVTKDSTEKGYTVSETNQPEQHSDHPAPTEMETSESIELVNNAANRPRLERESFAQDIGVVEVTVQAEQETQQDVAPVDEEQVEVEEEQTQTTKTMKGRKRKTPIHKTKEMLDPSRMTLQDLIYYNPKGNHMKSSIDAKRKKLEQQKKTTNQTSTENQKNDSIVEEDDSQNTENQSNNQQTTESTDGGGDITVCAPQVKIGADGCIILDEESLVIRSPTYSALEDKDIIYEDAGDLNFDFCTKSKGRTAKWSMQETLKFYKVLSQVGTDFQLMAPLFPTRKRKELKAKFKREEKVNHHLVDKVLVYHTPISLEMFLKEQKGEGKKSKNSEEKQASNAAEEE